MIHIWIGSARIVHELLIVTYFILNIKSLNNAFLVLFCNVYTVFLKLVHVYCKFELYAENSCSHNILIILTLIFIINIITLSR